MLLKLLPFVPIVIAPLVAVGLAASLRRWVKYAERPAATSLPAGKEIAPVATTAAPRPTFADIAREANPLVAYALPILTSSAIVLLVLWPFAYLGWLIIELDPDPGWSAQVPPWFGDFGHFLGFGFAGLVVALLGGFVAAAIGFGLHALGKCILWPPLCACPGDTDDSTPGDDPPADAP